jgi:hypothetical protein
MDESMPSVDAGLPGAEEAAPAASVLGLTDGREKRLRP